ncbi:MAG: hypothetical protein WCW14_01080 [Candidatus Paceibacterota bacterium]
MEKFEVTEKPMKALDFLNIEASQDGEKDPELCILIGNLIEIINESAILSPGQQRHVHAILFNQGQKLVEVKGDISDKFSKYDEFLTNLSVFINTCR